MAARTGWRCKTNVMIGSQRLLLSTKRPRAMNCCPPIIRSDVMPIDRLPPCSSPPQTFPYAGRRRKAESRMGGRSISRPWSQYLRGLVAIPNGKDTAATPTSPRPSSSSSLSTAGSSLGGTTNATSANQTFKVAKVSALTGNVQTVILSTAELLKTTSINARDLFTLNLTSRQERFKARPIRRTGSAILPRKSVMVLSFGSVRAVVGLTDVYLMDAHNPAVQEFAIELGHMYKTANASAANNTNTGSSMNPGNATTEPHELIFLEEVLKDTVETFNRRLRLYEPIVDSFLDKVANEVYSDTGVHQLVPLKDSLQSFEIHVKQSLDCLTQLLDDDDAMLALLLTEQAEAERSGEPVPQARHEHVELLVGVYARQLSNILMEINFFLGRLQSKQEFVGLALASYRNRMVRMNVHIGIAGLGFGMATTINGFFGMNLLSGMETSTTAFYYVVVGSCLSGTVLAAVAMNYLSGRVMQQRAAQRLQEIETLNSALSDMCALDFALKSIVARGKPTDKERFGKMLVRARQSKQASAQEIELLFDIYDRMKDGQLTSEDFNTDVVGSVIFKPSGTFKLKT